MNTKNELIVINCSIIRLIVDFRTLRIMYFPLLPRPRASPLAVLTIKTRATPPRGIQTRATIVRLVMNAVLLIIRGLSNMAPIAIIHVIDFMITLVMVLRVNTTSVTTTEKASKVITVEIILEIITIKTTITTPKVETAFHPTKTMISKWLNPGPNQFISKREVDLMKLRTKRIEVLNEGSAVAGLVKKKFQESLTTKRCQDTRVVVLLDKDFSLVIKAGTEGSITGTIINREIIGEVAIRKEVIKVVDISLTTEEITMTDSKEMIRSTSLLQPTLSWLLRRHQTTTSLRVLPSELTTYP